MLSSFLIKILLALLFIALAIPQKSEAESEQWCVGDPQTPDSELEAALNWACGKGGANCSDLQLNQPCFLPNTIWDHASFAFNSYYQNYKQKNGSCYFKGAAMITELDPSHGSCHYEYNP